jgi:hypothetical protein
MLTAIVGGIVGDVEERIDGDRMQRAAAGRGDDGDRRGDVIAELAVAFCEGIVVGLVEP